jgi:hypothetical protein
MKSARFLVLYLLLAGPLCAQIDHPSNGPLILPSTLLE